MALRALDLFCGAGGVAKGLQRAGFYVVGVDINSQPRYCGDEFIQADATTYPLDRGDFIWASPTCQHASSLRHLQTKTYPNFIPVTRQRLIAAGKPYAIENVMGAELVNPVILCGSAFGLGVRRHRGIETNFFIMAPECNHASQPHPIDVSGTGARRLGPRLDGKGGNSRKPRSLAEARAVMGIDWMSRRELSQAIPPAYSEYIGRAAVEYIRRVRAA